MNTYQYKVKLEVKKTIKTTTDVQAAGACKAKLKLEALYGKGNLASSPLFVHIK